MFNHSKKNPLEISPFFYFHFFLLFNANEIKVKTLKIASKIVSYFCRSIYGTITGIMSSLGEWCFILEENIWKAFIIITVAIISISFLPLSCAHNVPRIVAALGMQPRMR